MTKNKKRLSVTKEHRVSNGFWAYNLTYTQTTKLLTYFHIYGYNREMKHFWNADIYVYAKTKYTSIVYENLT